MKKLVFSFFSQFKKRNYYLIVFLFILMLVAIKTCYNVINKEENEGPEETSLVEEHTDSIIHADKSTNYVKPEIVDPASKEISKIEPKLDLPTIKPVAKKPSDLNPKAQVIKEDAINTILELHAGLKKISLQNFSNYKEIVQLIRSTLDVEKMTTMIIGNVWENIRIEKQKEMLLVFEEFIAKSYIKRFIKIKQPDFESGESKKFGNNYMKVKTNLVLKENEKVSIDYLLTVKDGKWKVFDVLLNGSISEVATRKSEFSGFIKNGEIDPLIDALRKKNSTLLKK